MQNNCKTLWILYLVLIPLKLKLVTELRLERPLSLVEQVSIGEVCDGESRPRSSLTAESGLSGSGSELLMLTFALFLAALFRNEQREFSICEQQTNRHLWACREKIPPAGLAGCFLMYLYTNYLCLNTGVFLR